jgi:hypothetical protein
LPNYSANETVKFDIFANQGLLNSTSGIVSTVQGNTTDTVLVATTPATVAVTSATAQAFVRFDLDTSTGIATYIGSKQIYVSIHVSMTFTKQDKGTDDYTFYVGLNGTAISGSALTIPDLDDSTGSISLVYGTLLNQSDTIELMVSSVGGDDMLVNQYTLLIRE